MVLTDVVGDPLATKKGSLVAHRQNKQDDDYMNNKAKALACLMEGKRKSFAERGGCFSTKKRRSFCNHKEEVAS